MRPSKMTATPAVFFFSFLSYKFRCVQDAGNRIKAYAHTLYKNRILFFSSCLVRVVSPVIYHFSFTRQGSKFFFPQKKVEYLMHVIWPTWRGEHTHEWRIPLRQSDTDLMPGGGGDSISKRHNGCAKIRSSSRSGAEHIFALTFLWFIDGKSESVQHHFYDNFIFPFCVWLPFHSHPPLARTRCSSRYGNLHEHRRRPMLLGSSIFFGASLTMLLQARLRTWLLSHARHSTDNRKCENIKLRIFQKQNDQKKTESKYESSLHGIDIEHRAE